jgi:hypothetical protein
MSDCKVEPARRGILKGLGVAVATGIGLTATSWQASAAATDGVTLPAGPVNRDIQLSDYCKGDGTDEAVALQAAFTAAAGGTLVIPPSFVVRSTATIRVPSGIRVVGYGRFSVLDFQVAADNLSWPRLEFDGSQDVRLESFTVDSTNATSRISGVGLLSFKGVQGLRAVDVISQHSPSTCWWFGNDANNPGHNTDVVLTDCQSLDSYADGLHISRNSDHFDVVNYRASGCADDGFAVVGYMQDGSNAWPAPSFIRLRGARIRNLTGACARGVAIVGGNNIDLDDVNVECVPGQGILVGRDAPTHFNHDVRIHGARVVSSGSSAFWVSNVRYFTGNDLRADSPGLDGLTFWGTAMDVDISSLTVNKPGKRVVDGTQRFSTDATMLAELGSALKAPITSAGLDRITLRGVTGSSPFTDGIRLAGESGRTSTRINLYDCLVRGVNRSGSGGSVYGVNLSNINGLSYDRLTVEPGANAFTSAFQLTNLCDVIRGLTTPTTSSDPALRGGESTISRAETTSSLVLTNRVLQLAFFTATKTEACTRVRLNTGNVAAGATPTLCRVGVYVVNADNSLSLVASSPNDRLLFKSANTAFTKVFSAPFIKCAGLRYAIGVLVVTPARLPTLAGANFSGASAEVTQMPRLAAQVAGQGNLPATISAAALTASRLIPYAVVLP